MSQFARYVRQFGGGLQQFIEDAKDGATIFAPSNEAFDPNIRYRFDKIVGLKKVEFKSSQAKSNTEALIL